MKASTFIQTALIDQMQQIADLGLWFHLAKLLPAGVELLARVTYCHEEWWKEAYHVGPAGALSIAVNSFYKWHFPGHPDLYSMGKDFYSEKPRIWLTSDPEYAEKHLTRIARPIMIVAMIRMPPPPQTYLHVPQWFADFKAACQIVLDKIESGELEDIEVLRTIE